MEPITKEKGRYRSPDREKPSAKMDIAISFY